MQFLDRYSLIQVCLNLRVKDLLNFCISCKKIYNDIWLSDYFWELRLKKDYPETCESNLFEENIRKNMKEEKLSYFSIFKSILCRHTPWYHTKCDTSTQDPIIIFDEVKSGYIKQNYFILNLDLNFHINGKFPKGTKIWLSVTENSKAFISKKQAVQRILQLIYEQFKSFYLDIEARKNFIEEFHMTPEEYFKCDLQDLYSIYYKILYNEEKIFAPSLDYPDYPDCYQIKQLTIA